MESDDIILLRRKLRTANREGKPILVCAECLTKLELRCNKLSRKNRGKDYYFFKHYKDVKECSIKLTLTCLLEYCWLENMKM